MKATIIIEKGLDGSFDVRTDDTFNADYMVLGQGATIDEAKADFLTCYNDIKQLYQDENKSFTEITEMVYRYDTASFLAYYSKVFSYASLERLTGVNQTQLSQYVQGYRKPSPKTTKKIEVALHNLAHELQQIQFV